MNSLPPSGARDRSASPSVQRECAECGNDEDVHPLPWLESLNGPPTITFEAGFEGKLWHAFVEPE